MFTYYLKLALLALKRTPVLSTLMVLAIAAKLAVTEVSTAIIAGIASLAS